VHRRVLFKVVREILKRRCEITLICVKQVCAMGCNDGIWRRRDESALSRGDLLIITEQAHLSTKSLLEFGKNLEIGFV
jgi:hypothetical protein